MKEVESKAIEVIPTTHTLNIAAVQEKIEEGEKLLSDIQASLAKVKKEAFNRKKIFVGVIASILIMVVLFYLKLRSVSKK